MASGGSQPSLPSSSGLTSASTFSDIPTLEADLSSSLKVFEQFMRNMGTHYIVCAARL